MSKGIFITGTGTDVGKTYITALILKKLVESSYSCGYYKAALSGADNISDSDAGYVKKIANLTQSDDTLISYLYKLPVSPHLASKIEGQAAQITVIKKDFKIVTDNYEYVVVEGSGGIICPIRYDDESHIMLEDIVKELNLETLVVADAGLGTINVTVLTISYLKQKNMGVKGIIINNYEDTQMQQDNIRMIEDITNIPVIAKVEKEAANIDIQTTTLISLFKEV